MAEWSGDVSGYGIPDEDDCVAWAVIFPPAFGSREEAAAFRDRVIQGAAAIAAPVARQAGFLAGDSAGTVRTRGRKG